MLRSIRSGNSITLIILHFSPNSENAMCTDEIRTNMSSICRGCTYSHVSVCRTSSRVYAVLSRLDSPRKRFDYGNLISRFIFAPCLSSHFMRKCTLMRSCTFSMILSNTALFTSLNKFFSKSVLAKVLNFVFNSK